MSDLEDRAHVLHHSDLAEGCISCLFWISVVEFTYANMPETLPCVRAAQQRVPDCYCRYYPVRCALSMSLM